ncbi:unnamed protein product, partial [Mesorhabditis belari]|uniref:Uncharacterized protein n=1 Tax=Mesorhabditis belari TaxID=2138241 RepID=A0AAF3FM27_9BILA
MLYKIDNYSIVLFGIYDQKVIEKNEDLTKWFWVALTLEVLGMMLSCGSGLLMIKIVRNSSTFHKNLRHILIIFITEYLISEMFRIVLMGYQFGYLSITGNVYIDSPLLIISLYRIYIYCAALSMLANALMERTFAVFFFRDYEYIERSWIQWFIQGTVTTGCAFSGVGYTFYGTQQPQLFFEIICAILLSLIVIGSLAFLFISHLNASFLKLLLTTFDIKKYTLSRRFQLEENVKALLLIKRIVLSHGLYAIFGVLLFAGPYVIFELNTPELELSIAFFETSASNIYYDFPLLIFSSYRFYVYCAAVVLLSNMLFERALAIFFIRDYEWKRRRWIIWALHTNSIVVQSFSVLMYTLMACYYNGFIFKVMYPYMLVWLSNAFWVFLFISHLNKRFLAFILKTFDLNKYTLSRRFQLEENVKALSFIRKIFILHCVFCLMAMNVFALPHLIFEMGTPEMELCIAALEATQGIYGITMNTMMIYMVPSWRKKLKSYKTMWVRGKPNTKSPTIEQRQMSATEEANIYFMELGKMWA